MLRQDDPFSPFLFVICGGGFSALTRRAVYNKNLKRLRMSNGGPEITFRG